MTYTKKEDAGQYLIDCSKSVKSGDRQEIGDLCGFKIFIRFELQCMQYIWQIHFPLTGFY